MCYFTHTQIVNLTMRFEYLGFTGDGVILAGTLKESSNCICTLVIGFPCDGLCVREYHILDETQGGQV